MPQDRHFLIPKLPDTIRCLEIKLHDKPEKGVIANLLNLISQTNNIMAYRQWTDDQIRDEIEFLQIDIETRVDNIREINQNLMDLRGALEEEPTATDLHELIEHFQNKLAEENAELQRSQLFIRTLEDELLARTQTAPKGGTRNLAPLAKAIQIKIKGLHVVGSLARGEPANDIDFITTNDLGNPDRKYIHFEYKGVPVDIWKVDNLKIGKFLRTYPKHVLIAIHKGLKKNGYKLLSTGIQSIKTGEMIPFTIKRIFELAGLPYRPLKSG